MKFKVKKIVTVVLVWVLLLGSLQTTSVDAQRQKNPISIYLDGENGDDSKNGLAKSEAVKTYEKAASMVEPGGIIYISGTVTLEEDAVWNIQVDRSAGYMGNLVITKKQLTLDGITMNREDIKGDVVTINEGMLLKKNVLEVLVEDTVEGKEIKPNVIKNESQATISYKYKKLEDSEFTKEVPSSVGDYTMLASTPSGKGYSYTQIEVDFSILEANKEEGSQDSEIIVPPTEDEGKEEETIPSNPETDKEEIIPSNPETDKEEIIPSNPETDKEEIIPSNPETDKEETIPSNPEADKEETIPSNPETDKEETMPSNPETDKEETMPSNPETDKEETKPTNPETDKEETIPSNPEGGEEEIIIAKPTNPMPEKVEERPLTNQEKLDQAKKVINDITEAILALPIEVTNKEQVHKILKVTKNYEVLDSTYRKMIAIDTLEYLQKVHEGAKLFNRTSNGVSVSGDFPWYIEFRVELNNDTSNYEKPNVDKIVAPYDLKLWNLMTDEEYRLDAGKKVLINMPLPNLDGIEHITIVHYTEGGTVEYITPMIGNGRMTFETSSFSPFDIAGSTILIGGELIAKDYDTQSKPQEEAKAEEGEKNKDTTASIQSNSSSEKPSKTTNSSKLNAVKTSDDTKQVIFILLLGVSGVVCATILMKDIKKKRKLKKQ